MDINPTRHATNIGSGRSRLPNQPTFTGVSFGPGYTTTAKNALALGTAGEGTVVYDTTLNALCLWTGAAWLTVTAA